MQRDASCFTVRMCGLCRNLVKMKRCAFAISNVYMNALKRMQRDYTINGVRVTCASWHVNCCFPFLKKNSLVSLYRCELCGGFINRFGDTEGASCAPKAPIWTSTRDPAVAHNPDTLVPSTFSFLECLQ